MYNMGDWDKAPKPLRDGWVYELPGMTERSRRCREEKRKREDERQEKG